MKDLYTYIIESKRLSDLKGKRVGKIEVDGNLQWESNNLVVTIQNTEDLTIPEAEEIIKSIHRNNFIQIHIPYDKKHEVTLEMWWRESKHLIEYDKFVNHKLVYNGYWVYDDANDLHTMLKNIII